MSNVRQVIGFGLQVAGLKKKGTMLRAQNKGKDIKKEGHNSLCPYT